VFALNGRAESGGGRGCCTLCVALIEFCTFSSVSSSTSLSSHPRKFNSLGVCAMGSDIIRLLHLIPLPPALSHNSTPPPQKSHLIPLLLDASFRHLSSSPSCFTFLLYLISSLTFASVLRVMKRRSDTLAISTLFTV
jgi:hypothetical protein